MVARAERIVLLGADYGVYGTYEIRTLPSGVTAAISVGRDCESPSRLFKGDPDVPNEDAVAVVEVGQRRLMAVADAHFGHESSHELIARLAETSVVPTTIDELRSLVAALAEGGSASAGSEASFVVTVYHGDDATGFGLSFGDASCAVIAAAPDRNPLNLQDARYVTAALPQSLTDGAAFRFDAEPGELIALFSDGVNECHYRCPESSITPEHMSALYAKTGSDAALFARCVMELALAGVGGNPGGQDNIALVVCPAGNVAW